MIRTLVYLDADLASSIALRYACQLSNMVAMNLQTAHVEEPDQDGYAPGTGWVRRTWESAMVKTGEFEIGQLINAEKSSCPHLGPPRMLVGDRENEILREIQRESYDLFIEGSLQSFTGKKFLNKIQSRLYRLIPCPVVVVKNLVSLERIALILREEVEAQRVISLFQHIFKGAKVDLDLIYCDFTEPGEKVLEEKEASNATLQSSEKILAEQGWQVGDCRIVQGSPEEIGDLLRNYGLIVSPIHRVISKKSRWLQMLSQTPSPILLCWQ